MVVLQSVIATAQTFPAHPRKGFIYDGAHLLKTSDEEKVDSLSRTFKSKAGAPIVVATLPSLATMDAKSIGIEKYATALFDEWRIGSREHNWGILLLVSKADHKARIEFGKAWGHDADTQSHAIMQAAILPAFKRGDYSDGIVKGCEALAKLTPSVTPSTAPATTVSNASPPQLTEISGPPVEFVDGPQNIDSGGGFLSSGLLFLIVPVVFLIIIVAAVAGRRRGGLSRTYNSPFGTGGNVYNSTTIVNNDDSAFNAGLIAGSAMSQPGYDSGTSIDSSPSADMGSSFDSGSSASDSGSSDTGGSSDSGSSGGGGDTGSW